MAALPTLDGLKVGRKVEVKDSRGHWYLSEINEVDASDGTTWIKVAYDDWSSKYDEWVEDAARVRKPRGGQKTIFETMQKVQGNTKGLVIVDGEPMYEVQKIHRSRVKNHKREYLVQWAGYGR